jgi:putative sterol carrier protein
LIKVHKKGGVMEFWKDTQECVTTIGKLWEECFKDPELSEALKKINQLVLFDFMESGPDCAVWIDLRGGKLVVGGGIPKDTPDLVMRTSADNAHRVWLNKLNPTVAIGTGKIKVKGSPIGLLKLAPKLKKVAALYNKVLKENGMSDKIL